MFRLQSESKLIEHAVVPWYAHHCCLHTSLLMSTIACLM